MKLVKLGFSALFSLAVVGCSQTPSHVILAPQITQPVVATYQQTPVTFSVQDLRASQHIVQILKKDQAATLYSPQTPLSDVLSQTFSDTLKKQGVMLTSSGSKTITVTIEKALVSVNQELMKYTANSEIVLELKVTNGDKTQTNVFTTRGNSNGPLSADLAVLERDLNQQLGKFITDIATNAELINFIKE
ncbi:YajG family lipoprotein [Thalassotalea euphylliae]|uniref:YajG family lipoprotein n=1 Tax=Thalassotalea euphylliae TaxID=1655234 RepID=UPI00363A54C0